LSGEAVPITVRPVSVLASCTTIEPTPPAAPSTSSVPPLSLLPSRNRSNNASHAVIVVKGSAAASAKSRLARRFSVQDVPTLMVLHRGEVIARQPGAAPLDVLRRWLDDAIARIPTGGKD